MELISKDDAIKCFDMTIKVRSLESAEIFGGYIKTTISRIKALPTIEERKEGTWVELQQNDDGTHNIQCSICRYCFKSKGHARSIYTREHFVYCPHCGVKQSQINTTENTNEIQSKPTATKSTEVPWWKGE